MEEFNQCSKYIQFIMVIALVVSLIMAGSHEARPLSGQVVVGCSGGTGSGRTSTDQTRFGTLRTMLPKASIFSIKTKTQIQTQTSSGRLLYDRIQVIRDPKTSVVPEYHYWSNGLVKEEALIKDNYEILSKS
ncbi:hypothetical protein ACOSQ2_002408 [Xanthoceras sorbifolium]